MTEILHRAVPVQLERVDRRTLACRYAPFGVKAIAIDALPNGSIDRYTEEFAPTIFDRQLNAAVTAQGVFQRITMVDEHDGGLGKIGFTVSLRKEADGVYGETRLLPSKIDDVDALLEEGVDKLSVEFIPLRGGTKLMRDGTRLRTDGHLHRVALVSQGAYAGSEVLAKREAEEVASQVDAEFQAQKDELDAWLAEQQAAQEAWNARISS